jgi:hypothetical protein
MKPRVQEFRRFTDRLLGSAPLGYIPHFFRCSPNSKTPALEFGSWSSIRNRLTIEQAENWMEEGGNIGIAGMPYDPLTIVDQDHGLLNWNIKTLRTRSRSRVGLHNYCFSADPKIPNIPTDHAGEVRSQGQYVIAPGSYVPTDPDGVPPEDRGNTGYYTIEEDLPVAWITYDDLPEVFREAHEKQAIEQPTEAPRTVKPTGRHSAVFDVTARDVVIRNGKPTAPNKRWGSIFHDSDTEQNMSLSTEGLLHCWRHNCTFGGLQALAVLSGRFTCLEVGTPHRGGRRTLSDEAIFHAWLYAKKHGYIKEDDPCPTRALAYIAKKHLDYTAEENKPLPRDIYRKALKILEVEY